MTEDRKNSGDVQFTLAKMWHVRGKLERAIAGYQEVIRRRPDYGAAHLELGGLMQQQGRIEEAIEVYRRAAEFNPDETVFKNILHRLLIEQTESSIENSEASSAASESFQPKDKGRGNILLYTDCPDANGAGQCSHLLLCELKSQGYNTTCVQSKASHYLIDERKWLGIPLVWIKEDNIYDKTKTARAFTNFAEAESVFSKTKPNLIIFADGCPLSSLAAKQTAIRLGIPYIAIIHCVAAEWVEQFASHLNKLPQVYERAVTVITVSQQNLSLLRKSFGLRDNRGQVIYNGRPSLFFNSSDPWARQRLREEMRIPAEAVVAFTSGRMEIVKGYQYQLSAIQYLRQSEAWPFLHFVWAGAGTIENNLRAAVERLGVSNKVRFLGERADIPALLDAADLFILPSQFEGMPLSIMEAMAKGLPVIATSVGGIPEELGVSGKLLPDPKVDPQATIKSLADTIKIWARDAELRLSIGKACKKRAKNMFRAEQMLKKYTEIIEGVLAFKHLIS